MQNTALASALAFGLTAILLSISSFSASGSSAEMYYSMGQRYMDEDEFDMAVIAFGKAVEAAPDWPEAHNALGEAYTKLLRFEDALAEFDKAIELKPDYTQAQMNRRRAMMAIKRYEPMRRSRLNRWQKAVILGGITAVIAIISALIVHSSS